MRKIAQITHNANEKIEDIGARRLHTILERVLEDISFASDEYSFKSVQINAQLVESKIESIAQNQDLAKYIL